MPRTNASDKLEVSPEDNSKPESVLEEAERIINGPRAAEYGPPKVNFKDIADGWTLLLRNKLQPGEYIAPEEVAELMIWLKLMRLQNGGSRDSVVDIAGYAGTIAKVLDL